MRRLTAALEARVRDLPLRRKLVVVITTTSAVALLVASGALIALDVQRFRADVREDLEAMAHILGNAASASLSAGDVASVDDLLAALAAKPQIASAALYDASGRAVGVYRRDDGAEAPPAHAASAGLREKSDELEVVEPVMARGRRVGAVFVRGSLDGLSSRVRTRMTTVGLVLLAAWLLTLLLSAWLQRLVSDPLLQLAATARQVSVRQDYTLRAAPVGRDEIGLLVTAFNDMLSQIERRDAELTTLTAELERRVTERTEQLRRELSVRRRAEEELERRNAQLVSTNRELDDFAYIASHDLKEPLRGIHNYARFLLEDYGTRFDPEGRAKLDTLVRLSRRMELLIDSLLHFSRLGRTDIAVAPVDAQEVLEEVLDSLVITLREQRIDVRVPVRLPIVEADRVHLGEAFANLVTNAVKYNDKASRWIEIGTCAVERRDGDGSRHATAFYVRDNGIGIPAKHLDSVFRIFKRLHARDEFGGGTGAGLTIVRKIVERHRGRIWIESSPGEGTTVFFTLQEGA